MAALGAMSSRTASGQLIRLRGDSNLGIVHPSIARLRGDSVLNLNSRSRSSSAGSVDDWRIRSLSTTEDNALPSEVLKRFENIAREAAASKKHSSSDDEDDDDVDELRVTPQRKRANTSNTIFLASTLQKPNKDGLLKGISVIVFQHIETARKKKHNRSNSLYDVFNLNYPEPVPLSEKQKPVTLNEIYTFLSTIYRKAQMEPECIVMSLVYIEKLMKYTESQMPLNYANWKPVLLSCFILASKVWDDLSMWNADFSVICPQFNLKRINSLESHLLSDLKFEVRIMSSTYAKYYFKLYTMRKEASLEDVNITLDIEGAKKLEINTHPGYKFATTTTSVPVTKNVKRGRSTSNVIDNKTTHLNASLEELVVMSTLGRRSSTGVDIWQKK